MPKSFPKRLPVRVPILKLQDRDVQRAIEDVYLALADSHLYTDTKTGKRYQIEVEDAMLKLKEVEG